MKKIPFVLCLLLSAISVFAQEKENIKYGKGAITFINGEILFSEVVGVEGKTANELYSLAKLAIAKVFVSAKDVIQLDDKEKGIIVVKGLYYAPNSATKPYYTFMIKLLFKDGKYKIDLTDFIYHTDIEELSANSFTDERCFDKKGKEKQIGKFARRFLIDTKDYIMNSFKDNLLKSEENENW